MDNYEMYMIYYGTSRGLGLFSIFVEAFRVSGAGEWKDNTSMDLSSAFMLTLVPFIGDIALLMFVPSMLILQPLDRWFASRSARAVLARQKKYLEEQEKNRVLAGKITEELLSELGNKSKE